MPTPTVITDLSTTAASNFPAGSDAPSTIDDTLRAHAAFVAQLYAGTNGAGYRTGLGGAVTQATSKSTGVTLNKYCGQITMHAAALGAGATATFLVTNSLVVATDCVVVNVGGGQGNVATYTAHVDSLSSGQFFITVTNISAGQLSEALIINFAVIKGVTS
jgi:hypothetical protein